MAGALSIPDLPDHLILTILTSGRLAAADLASLESTSRLFRSRDSTPVNSLSMAESAAFYLAAADPILRTFPAGARGDLFDRCGRSWKKVVRFLQSVDQSSAVVQTTAGKMQVAAGRYHTLLIHDSSVYSCGSSLRGVLGHGQDMTQCVAFNPISFPTRSNVIHVSASHNHAAFVTQSGEVPIA